MSLIVTVCTSEGIVMASDSRSTYNSTETHGEKVIVKFGVHYSDTTYKTFLCGDRIGISTCGEGAIVGKSIAGHIEDFINNVYVEGDCIETTATKLRDFFSTIPEKSDVLFHVAGYKKENDRNVAVVYSVATATGQVVIRQDGGFGASWNGETAILTRLMKNSYVTEEKNVTPISSLTAIRKNATGFEEEISLKDQIAIPADSLRQPELDVAWHLMTLQDGIEFAEYAIKTTIDTMRFQVAPKTVGGPIDILVIKPNGARWIQHKELHA